MKILANKALITAVFCIL